MHVALTISLSLMALWFFTGIVNGVRQVGKERKPMTGADASRATVAGGILIAVLAWAAVYVSVTH